MWNPFPDGKIDGIDLDIVRKYKILLRFAKLLPWHCNGKNLLAIALAFQLSGIEPESKYVVVGILLGPFCSILSAIYSILDNPCDFNHNTSYFEKIDVNPGYENG